MRPRIIPGFQISKGELVHIIEFNKNSKRYIGDPLNTLRIFNQFDCDEISIVDVDAWRNGIDFGLLEKISEEIFLPLSYGGGIKNFNEASKIIGLGFEKIIFNDTIFSNINFSAGGLNHFSVLLNVNYKDTGEDGYPIIRKNFDDYYSGLVNQHEGFKSKPGAERGVFKKLFQEYKYLPITTDSHLGEYLQWAYSVADHDAILDFYDNYKVKCLNFYNDAEHYNHFFDLNNSETHERVIPIIEAIIGDTGLEESAVNIPNNEYIDCLPDRIVVEVPAKINNQGIHGITLENYPKGFGNLLNSQVGVIQLTTEAILSKSKHFAYLALLADPVVDNAIAAEKLLDNIIEKQSEFLGYLN